MFKFTNKLVMPFLVFLIGLLTSATNSAIAENIKDPMQPPAFALNKFRLAKLKKSGLPRTQASNTKKPVTKSLRLSSILIGKSRKIAIINEQMLVVGDKVEGARLVKISKDRVQLSRRGKKIELKLKNEIKAIRKLAAESKL